MLSILIPTYNFNVIPLVESLNNQLIKLDIEYEIICIDDDSKSHLNKANDKINLLDNSIFLSLNKNIGRSATRNLLFKKSKYDWLLFLDADVKPISSNFIKNYISQIQNSPNKVFCGGVKYESSEKNKSLLRYKYGNKYEDVSPSKRNKFPYKYFFSSNFLIHKSIFKKITFNESLKKYGREDLLFSLNLKKNNFIIEHINNGVYHLGIDDDKTFVDKTKHALENLYYIEKNGLINFEDVSLLRLIHFIKSIKISKILGKFYSYLEDKTIIKSSLFYLKFMKISYLCHLNNSDLK